jgi:Xaa-Pro aminopeptidase
VTNEFETKQERIRALLEKYKLDGLLLRRSNNFAWATCGASASINIAESNGEVSLLITRTGRHLVTNNIEAARLVQEEKLDADWEFHTAPWYEVQQKTIDSLVRGLKLGGDGCWAGELDLSAELIHLRANLTPEEGNRFRELGRLCAEAMEAAILAVRPGHSEYEIAALLTTESERRGVQAIVNLVATDERVFAFRHPLPTAKRLDRYAMLVLCGRKSGLVCSITRLVHFGRIPDELRRKAEAVGSVGATFITATKPGATLGAIFLEAMQTYTTEGFPREWQLHHQGGLAGYLPREIIASPDSNVPVQAGQVFAWNPSITGVKSEDTILIKEHGNEDLTAIQAWPMLEVHLNGQTFLRPAILERD